jgi:5'-nucleotidase
VRRILVTNDDGVFSPGIRALAEALRALGEVIVVAPLSEASAIGHALTLRRPLRIETIEQGYYGVDGTPTDCVNLGIRILLEGQNPDLIASGINRGSNLGDDVTYSGTVAGALEGALLGIPALAVSLESSGRDFDFGPAARTARRVADAMLRQPLGPRVLLNVNVPQGPIKGVRQTVQGKRNHVTAVSARVDPRGRPYYWIDEAQCEWDLHDRSDYVAVRDGYISVTPLQPDLTAHDVLPQLGGLALDIEAEVG